MLWCCHPFSKSIHKIIVVVLHDKEEAAYFQNDLQNLLSREILLFPMSYKRPYEFDEIENANVLMRTEVLNLLVKQNNT